MVHFDYCKYIYMERNLVGNSNRINCLEHTSSYYSALLVQFARWKLESASRGEELLFDCESVTKRLASKLSSCGSFWWLTGIMKRARVTVNHREDRRWRQVDNYPRKRSDWHVAATSSDPPRPVIFSTMRLRNCADYEENEEIDFQHGIVQSSNRISKYSFLKILLLPLLGDRQRLSLLLGDLQTREFYDSLHSAWSICYVLQKRLSRLSNKLNRTRAMKLESAKWDFWKKKKRKNFKVVCLVSRLSFS